MAKRSPTSPKTPPKKRAASTSDVTTPTRMVPADAQIAALMQTLAQDTEMNRTYTNCAKRYMKYVTTQKADKLELFELPAGKYVSVIAVEHFFLDFILKETTGTSRNAMKYLYPIPHLSTAEGTNLSLNDLNTKVIKDVCRLLNKKKEAREDAADKEGKGPDSQEKMLSTEIVSQQGLSNVLSKLLESEKQWERTATKISTLSTTLLRHNSSLKVNLGKLCLSYLHPDGDDIPHDFEVYDCKGEPVLGIIRPKKDQEKRQNTPYDEKRDEVLGGFRHKRHERCFIGIIAMSLFAKFNDEKYAKNFNFFKMKTPAVVVTAATAAANPAGTIASVMVPRSLTFPSSSLSDDEEEDDGDDDDPDQPEVDIDESNLLWRKHLVFPSKYPSTNRSIKKAFVMAKEPFWEKVTHLK